MDVSDVINGWRIVEDAGTGRSGRVFIVCREVDPDRLFALKMQQTDRPDVAPDANARHEGIFAIIPACAPLGEPALKASHSIGGDSYFFYTFFIHGLESCDAFLI